MNYIIWVNDSAVRRDNSGGYGLVGRELASKFTIAQVVAFIPTIIALFDDFDSVEVKPAAY